MSYEVMSIASFEKQARRLIKKYPSLKKELWNLVQVLKQDPQHGTPIGKNCFKIRIAIASKGKRKGGGARVITNLVITNRSVYLLYIYDKSQQESISDKELLDLLQFIPK